MELVLYDNRASSNALKVRFLLAELELEYKAVEVPLGRPRPDWYTAVNPLGGVPTLVDDSFTLAESNAILRYLTAREGRDDLYPADLQARACVDRILDTWSTAVRPAIYPLERAVGVFGGERDETGIEAARPAVEAIFDAVELLVADNGTATGAFTIGDVCAAPTLFRSLNAPLPLDFARWPKLDLLRRAVTARPAFAAAGPVR